MWCDQFYKLIAGKWELRPVSMLDILKGLLRQAVKCKRIEEFEKMLELANRKAAD